MRPPGSGLSIIPRRLYHDEIPQVYHGGSFWYSRGSSVHSCSNSGASIWRSLMCHIRSVLAPALMSAHSVLLLIGNAVPATRIESPSITSAGPDTTACNASGSTSVVGEAAEVVVASELLESVSDEQYAITLASMSMPNNPPIMSFMLFPFSLLIFFSAFGGFSLKGPDFNRIRSAPGAGAAEPGIRSRPIMDRGVALGRRRSPRIPPRPPVCIFPRRPGSRPHRA